MTKTIIQLTHGDPFIIKGEPYFTDPTLSDFAEVEATEDPKRCGFIPLFLEGQKVIINRRQIVTMVILEDNEDTGISK